MTWWIINGVYIILICLLYYNYLYVTTNINSLNGNLLQNTSQIITHRPIPKCLFVLLLNYSLLNVIKKTFYFYYCTRLRAVPHRNSPNSGALTYMSLRGTLVAWPTRWYHLLLLTAESILYSILLGITREGVFFYSRQIGFSWIWTHYLLENRTHFIPRKNRRQNETKIKCITQW